MGRVLSKKNVKIKNMLPKNHVLGEITLKR